MPGLEPDAFTTSEAREPDVFCLAAKRPKPLVT